ncbi:hypothetical protein KAR91_11710 [Candidatus Pacearchaeota archaeon]|nr:hypothetical protein [Candidatus Pacearchaeota archaeon]
MIVKLGDYLPDLPSIGNPGLTLAKNVIPYAQSYRPLAGLAVSSNALASRARGYIAVADKDGNVYNYAADQSNIYSLADSATWTTVTSSASGQYSTGTDGLWEFARWGETVLATNYVDNVQSIPMGGSHFESLAGTPPKARHIGIVRDFVVLGNVTDFSTGAAVTNRIHWSGFGNEQTYEPSANTQADYQTLQGGGGAVQRVVGGEYGIIFQEFSIQRMTYVGSPVVFQLDEVEAGRGTPCPTSVPQIPYGQFIPYLGQDDFYIFNGVSSKPIGHDRVFKTFTDDYDVDYSDRVSIGIDPTSTVIMWSYPSNGAGGVPDKILIYNWTVDKWAIAELNVEMLVQTKAIGYTLEGLDAVSASIDALTHSLDSRVWTGGTLNLGAFDVLHQLNNFTGSAMNAVFETGERQLIRGSRALVTNIRPIVDGGTVTVAVGKRDLPTGSASFGSAVSVNIAGECPQMKEGRYHKFRVNVTGDFEHAQGFDVSAVATGAY